MTLFKSYRDSIIIKDHVKSKNVIVGEYTYYSGYYHGQPFDDCVMYLDEGFDGYTTVPPKAHKLKGNTVVGNDVWVGAEAMIMPGVKMADGAVIGARSLVTKDIGPYEIWAGNPARLIKQRFDDRDIEKLLQIKCWDWDIQKIKDYLPFIRSNKVSDLWSKLQEEIS